jgi:hypothetical protein
MTLNEVMKDTADAIREKTGKSELIAPVDFASEIKGITAGGGGADLEGEYSLAKPNGRYWKSKLSTMTKKAGAEFPQISVEGIKAEDIETFSMSQLAFYMISYTSIIGGAQGLLDHGYQIYADYPQRVAELFGGFQCALEMTGECSRYWCSVAWEESTVISPLFCQMGLDGPIDVVTYMRILMEGEADGMTDDEILALCEDMLMIEQITKEEYESYYNW